MNSVSKKLQESNTTIIKSVQLTLILFFIPIISWLNFAKIESFTQIQGITNWSIPAYDFYAPSELSITRILVKNGDYISQDEPVLELTNNTLLAPNSGVIFSRKILEIKEIMQKIASSFVYSPKKVN